jgi:hypothetical protein
LKRRSVLADQAERNAKKEVAKENVQMKARLDRIEKYLNVK